MAKQKQTSKPKTGDAGRAAADYYTHIPSSADGEFVHANAQLADLNQSGSTETQRTGDGVPLK